MGSKSISAKMEKYKSIMMNAVVIIVALVIANNIYKSQAKSAAVLNEKKKIEIQKNEVLKSISGMEKEMSVLKNATGKRDPAVVMNAINDMARNSSVEIVSLKPDSEANYADYTVYSFTLEISAKAYYDIGRFIAKLENSPDHYVINNIQIYKVQEQQAEAREYTLPAYKQKGQIKISAISVKD